MTTPEGLKRLMGSSKAWIVMFTILGILLAVILGKITSEDAINVIKWLIITLVGATAVEDGAQKLGSTAAANTAVLTQPPAPTPDAGVTVNTVRVDAFPAEPVTKNDARKALGEKTMDKYDFTGGISANTSSLLVGSTGTTAFSDTVKLIRPARIMIHEAGAVKVTMLDGETVALPAIAVGIIHGFWVTQLWATGTAAGLQASDKLTLFYSRGVRRSLSVDLVLTLSVQCGSPG